MIGRAGVTGITDVRGVHRCEDWNHVYTDVSQVYISQAATPGHCYGGGGNRGRIMGRNLEEEWSELHGENKSMVGVMWYLMAGSINGN